MTLYLLGLENVNLMFKLGLNPFYKPNKAIIISDVHSEGDKLEALLNKVLPLQSTDDHLIFIGDLFGHGGQSLKVLRLIRNLQIRYPNQIFIIKGNHEIMMLDYFLDLPPTYPMKYDSSWIKYEGLKVSNEIKAEFNLESINYKLILQTLKDHDLWPVFENLIPYYETENLLVTHAPLDRTMLQLYTKGFHDYKNIEAKSLEGVLERMGDEIFWKFSSADSLPFSFGKQLICGHQKVGKTPKLFKERVFLDCGTGYDTTKPLFGIIYPGKKIISSL